MRYGVTWAYAAHRVRPETISCCCLLSGNCPILRASRSTDWQRRRASVLDANLPAFSAHSWSTLLRSGAAFLLPVSVTSRRTLTALVRPGAWDLSLSLSTICWWGLESLSHSSIFVLLVYCAALGECRAGVSVACAGCPRCRDVESLDALELALGPPEKVPICSSGFVLLDVFGVYGRGDGDLGGWNMEGRVRCTGWWECRSLAAG